MVKVPFVLHPVPPFSVHVPMITPSASVSFVPFNVPVTDVLVMESVLPPDTTVNEKVPLTWLAALGVTTKVPDGLGPVTGKHPGLIEVRN